MTERNAPFAGRVKNIAGAGRVKCRFDGRVIDRTPFRGGSGNFDSANSG